MCGFIEENEYKQPSFIVSTQVWPRGNRLEGEGVFSCVIGRVLKQKDERFVELVLAQISAIE